MYAVQFKDNITYINYGSFNFPIIDIDEVINIINRFSYAGGMIIDIRGNRGGQTQNIGELLSLFFSGTKIILMMETLDGDYQTFKANLSTVRGLRGP